MSKKKDDKSNPTIAQNRKALETFLRHHHAQGLSARQLTVEELFHPSTFETFKL